MFLEILFWFSSDGGLGGEFVVKSPERSGVVLLGND